MTAVNPTSGRVIQSVREEAAESVSRVFQELLAESTHWALSIAALPRENFASVERLDGAVEALVNRLLETDLGPIVGAGFIVRPGLLSSPAWHMAWWTLQTDSQGSKGKRPWYPEDDPARDGFYDYSTLAWWILPRDTGRPCVYGPFVDYMCTDGYILTISTPVHLGSEFAGTVGLDLSVSLLESLFLPALEKVGPAAALVTSSGRVLVSADASCSPGSIIREIDRASSGLTEVELQFDPPTDDVAGLLLSRCPGTPLLICTEQDASTRSSA